jgi:hypothetical protein
VCNLCVLGALLLFINLALMVMILVAGLGAIETEDGPAMEENGWYGQLSVCIFFTCLLWSLHGIFFAYWLRKRNLAAYEHEAAAYCDDNNQDNNNNNNNIMGQIPYVPWGGDGSDHHANNPKKMTAVTIRSDQPSVSNIQ